MGAGTAGGALVAVAEPAAVNGIVAAASALVGVVIGGVIAGMAILTAGLDTAFLRKLNQLPAEAEGYLAPFLATTAISIVAVVSLLVWGAVATVNNVVSGVVGGVSGGLVLWSLSSLIPALGTMVFFVGLRQDSTGGPSH